MKDFLIKGRSTIVAGAELELIQRGYKQVGPVVDKDLNKEICAVCNPEEKTFQEHIEDNSGITETESEYFLLPVDFDELIDHLDLIDELVADRALAAIGTEVVLQDQYATPVVKLTPEAKRFLMKCPNPSCGKIHFRHAGYVISLFGYKTEKEPEGISATPISNYVCVACKTSVIYVEGKIHDITSEIDLDAWKRTEIEAHKATGPGGQC